MDCVFRQPFFCFVCFFGLCQISYLDAILGNDNVHVEVVDGSVEIKVPAGCQPGTVLRIRGKGAPQLNNASVSQTVRHEYLYSINSIRAVTSSAQKVLGGVELLGTLYGKLALVV